MNMPGFVAEATISSRDATYMSTNAETKQKSRIVPQGASVRGNAWGRPECWRIDTGWQKASVFEGGEYWARTMAYKVLGNELQKLLISRSRQEQFPSEGRETMNECKHEGTFGQIVKCKIKYVQCFQ